jgi:hypothetical protein
MVFRDTQLGRFGVLCTQYFSAHGDPDIRAAHVLASNGVCYPNRPDLPTVLGSKLLIEDADPQWRSWNNSFSTLLHNYQRTGGSPLSGWCTQTWPGQPQGVCMHEMSAPLHYWSMRSFASRMQHNNVIQRADGTFGVDVSAQPIYNYVLTRRGEILVAPEDFGWVKHTSLAGGSDVWSAGQVGILNNQLRLIDLQSGHYVRSRLTPIMPGSNLARLLMQFTEDVFKAYFQAFNLAANLHPAFQCVWL